VIDYFDISKMPREELEQWYMQTQHTLGALVFQFGTEVNGSKQLELYKTTLEDMPIPARIMYWQVDDKYYMRLEKHSDQS